MQFLGSVRLDGSKRITVIKEVAEILELGPQDHVKFYLDHGEIVMRKVLPDEGKTEFTNSEFWEWARKREIEISMMSPEEAELAKAELDDRTDAMKDIGSQMRKFGNNRGPF